MRNNFLREALILSKRILNNTKKKKNMIHVGTVLRVIDNSGAKKAKCIKILSSKKNVGTVGDLILVSLQETISKQKRKVKKGEVHKAILTDTRKKLHRYDGSSLSFEQNTAILVSPRLLPLGTRVTGVVPYELRQKGYLKILSLASHVL